VEVFCWLGWNDPTIAYGPTSASAPWPNLGRGRAGWPSFSSERKTASQPNCPSGTMTRTRSRIAISRKRDGAQLSRLADAEQVEDRLEETRKQHHPLAPMAQEVALDDPRRATRGEQRDGRRATPVGG
jgi:hypothetical protein